VVFFLVSAQGKLFSKLRPPRPKTGYACAQNQSSIVAAQNWIFYRINLNCAQNQALLVLDILFSSVLIIAILSDLLYTVQVSYGQGWNFACRYKENLTWLTRKF